MEEMLSSYGCKSLPKGNVELFPLRIATVVCDREYMDYQFFAVDETITEIPFEAIHHKITGEYRLRLSIPCPRKLIVFKNTVTRIDPVVYKCLSISSYMHGFYGREKKESAAVQTMELLGYDYPEVSFQYGAWLKNKGDFGQAQRFLRKAAEHDIPGAKFELAELLLEKGEADEARKLLEELWQQGYRTYGISKSIDLLGEHPKKHFHEIESDDVELEDSPEEAYI